jgi:hypothetical protein
MSKPTATTPPAYPHYRIWSDQAAHYVGPIYINREAAQHFANHLAAQPYHAQHRARVDIRPSEGHAGEEVYRTEAIA